MGAAPWTDTNKSVYSYSNTSGICVFGVFEYVRIRINPWKYTDLFEYKYVFVFGGIWRYPYLLNLGGWKASNPLETTQIRSIFHKFPQIFQIQIHICIWMYLPFSKSMYLELSVTIWLSIWMYLAWPQFICSGRWSWVRPEVCSLGWWSHPKTIPKSNFWPLGHGPGNGKIRCHCNWWWIR